MPVGPSHSGRSRGSSGGGRSFSSSSSRRSHSSHSPRSHSSVSINGFHVPLFRPRFYHFFGRPVFLTTGLQALLSILIFFIIFMSILFSVNIGTVNAKKEYVQEYKNQIAIMEDDAIFFNELIDNANNAVNGYYLTTAEFGDNVYEYYMANPTNIGIYEAFEDDGVIWYFLVYNYKNGHGETLRGTTYTQFSASQYTSLNGKIQIAYTQVNGEWWSINTSYSLSNNRDYKLAKEDLAYYENSLKSSNTRVAIYGLIGIGLIAILVLIIVKKAKQTKQENAIAQEKAKAEVSEARAKAEQEQRKSKQINRTCHYCGSSVPDGSSKCPGCGSSNFK